MLGPVVWPQKGHVGPHCRGPIPSPSSRSQADAELCRGSVRADHGKSSPGQEAMRMREGGWWGGPCSPEFQLSARLLWGETGESREDTWDTHVTSQICCPLECSQWSYTLICPGKLSPARCSHARSGSLWQGKVPPSPLAVGLCSQESSLEGQCPTCPQLWGQAGHSQRPPIFTTGLCPAALLSLRITRSSLPRLMHSTLHPRAPEPPQTLHHHPSPSWASLAMPCCNQSRCPTRTAAKYPGSRMLPLKGA